MKKVNLRLKKCLNLEANHDYWISNIPEKVDTAVWKKIVEEQTNEKKDTTFKRLKSAYSTNNKQQLEKDEKEYQTKGKAGKIDTEVLKSHYTFLSNLYDLEKKRQENIEKKALQIISQTGIIISLITLSVSSLYEKITMLNGPAFCIIIVLFCLSLFLMLLTIVFAVSSLKRKLYSRPSSKIIMDPIGLDENKFLYEKVATTYNSIIDNTVVDNKKSSLVNISYILFFLSISSIIIFSFVSGRYLLSAEIKKQSNIKPPVKIELTNPIDAKQLIQRLDTIHNDLKNIKTK